MLPKLPSQWVGMRRVPPQSSASYWGQHGLSGALRYPLCPAKKEQNDCKVAVAIADLPGQPPVQIKLFKLDLVFLCRHNSWATLDLGRRPKGGRRLLESFTRADTGSPCLRPGMKSEISCP